MFLPGEDAPPMGLLKKMDYEFVAAELLHSGGISETSPYRIFYDRRPSAN